MSDTAGEKAAGSPADSTVGTSGREPVVDGAKATRRVAGAPRFGHRRRWVWWVLMAAVAVVLIVSSAGSPPTEGVSQNRLFNIASQLKCVECVGESVASSSAPIAVQFRQEITEQMAKGRTNDEILNFFAARYDDILLTPPAGGVGALVWVIPVVALFAAVVLLGAAFRNWRQDRSDREASVEDEDLVARALGGEVPADVSGGTPGE